MAETAHYPQLFPWGQGLRLATILRALSPQLAAWPTACTHVGAPCGEVSGVPREGAPCPSLLASDFPALLFWNGMLPSRPLVVGGWGGRGCCRTDVQVSGSWFLAAWVPVPAPNHIPDIHVGEEQSLLSCCFSHLLLYLILPNSDTESEMSKKKFTVHLLLAPNN